MTTKHIPQLDGLRAVACLLVLVAHLWRYPAGHEWLNRIAGCGWVGVDLFFVLSGFLITGILFRSKDEPGYFKNFYARRSLRIFPAYYLLLFLVLIVLPFFSNTDELMHVRRDGLWYAFYLSNVIIGMGGWILSLLNITWSLAIEEQFYLVWPSVVKWLSRERLVTVCCSLIVALPIARTILYPYIGWTWVYVATPLRIDAFAWGAVIALGLGSARIAWPMFLGGLLTLFAWIASGTFFREAPLVSGIGYSLTAMTAAGALYLTVNAKKTLLSWRPMREIGKVSYSLYLLHFLCGVMLSRVFEGRGLWGSFAFMITAGVIAFTVASLSFRFYETPFLKLKRFFESSAERESKPGAKSLAA